MLFVLRCIHFETDALIDRGAASVSHLPSCMTALISGTCRQGVGKEIVGGDSCEVRGSGSGSGSGMSLVFSCSDDLIFLPDTSHC